MKTNIELRIISNAVNLIMQSDNPEATACYCEAIQSAITRLQKKNTEHLRVISASAADCPQNINDPIPSK